MLAITRATTLQPRALSAPARAHLADALYKVHQQIFDGVDREAFVRYVVESKADETWIQTYENAEGRLVGYFAYHVYKRPFQGRETAIIRVELGLLEDYRGGSLPYRFAVEQTLRYVASHPTTPMLVLSTPVHPSSYRQLVRFADRVWPSPGVEVPGDVLAGMLSLADELGIRTVSGRDPLVRQVGWQTRESDERRRSWAQLDDPAARFYLAMNPGYPAGQGLLTLLPVTVGGVARGGARIVAAKIKGRWRRLFPVGDRASAPVDPAHHPGFFGPGTMVWRVHRELAVYASGPRALLLQMAHPKVAEGLRAHGGMSRDPLGRLFSTSRTMEAMLFGSRPEAEGASRRIAALHAEVSGAVLEDTGAHRAGEAYSATDPELLLWVLATLIDSSLLAYDALVAPLSADEREQYYREIVAASALLGLAPGEMPASYEAFCGYFAGMLEGDTLTVGAAARSLAAALFEQEQLGGAGSFVARTLAASTLPPRLRAAFGLPWAARDRIAARGLDTALRLFVRAAPGALREARPWDLWKRGAAKTHPSGRSAGGDARHRVGSPLDAR